MTNNINKNVAQPLTVIKVGGAVVEDEAQLQRLLTDFAHIPGHKVLVHGGGRRATKVAAALGIESKMVNGRRITDEHMLEVVTMVYGGLVNKQLVARLQALSINALGLTGADMNVMHSHRRPIKDGIDYGFVGDVDRADGRMLATLIAEGVTPVMAPLTHDGEGHMLNTNADTIAAETAKALAPYFDVTLVYCFEKAGVLANADDDASVISHINREAFTRLTADGTIVGGMIPKIENALDAVAKGVKQVRITSADSLGSPNSGTVVTI